MSYLVSIVIPTLGGESLLGTINQLNRGTVVPAEILVCIPTKEAAKLHTKYEQFSNVKIVITSFRGQVAQRIFGFKLAAYDFVLQLDDDILVDTGCIESLITAQIMHGPKSAVAPSLRSVSNGNSFYRAPTNRLLLDIYYWILNGSIGYKPGCLTKAGTNVGVDPDINCDYIVETEWLPGGCVLHHRDNLILENFYPFSGKAYSEDIYHSHYLRCAGVKLITTSRANCSVDDPKKCQEMTLNELKKYIISDYVARKFFVKLSGRSFIRMHIYYFIFVSRCLIGMVRRIQK